VFVFEVPYWKHLVQDRKFDQIYHEHVTYFTVKSSAFILRKAGMSIWKIEVVDYHGGSLRVYAKHGNHECKESEEMIKDEEILGLFKAETYEFFMNDIEEQKMCFMKHVFEIKSSSDEPIIAVGAAAKANTLLNYYGLNAGLIDYITDTSPHKQGKFTPLSRIPIVGDDEFSAYEKPYAVVLAWNIEHKIRPILDKINPNIQYISIGDSNGY